MKYLVDIWMLITMHAICEIWYFDLKDGIQLFSHQATAFVL
jgi:hypothetical protein